MHEVKSRKKKPKSHHVGNDTYDTCFSCLMLIDLLCLLLFSWRHRFVLSFVCRTLRVQREQILDCTNDLL